jgi:predicted acetyltransferase
MTITLVPIARERAATLGNLYELYAHDFSEFVPLAIKPSGRFEIVPSERWWQSPLHHPFFIQRGEELCGFALVSRSSHITDASEPMDMSEFFVLRSVRHAGVGSAAAQALFDMFPGAWEVRVRANNLAAFAFWSRVLTQRLASALDASEHVRSGVHWRVFNFVS